MKCTSEFCVHNKESVCSLDEIEIDSSAMCDSFELL